MLVESLQCLKAAMWDGIEKCRCDVKRGVENLCKNKKALDSELCRSTRPQKTPTLESRDVNNFNLSKLKPAAATEQRMYPEDPFEPHSKYWTAGAALLYKHWDESEGQSL
ncbi:Hypothetical predicted protein [Podarcis lilfordi]|uniref:Uncharacterized protein n=1 Tax=Podarcis lilfordi TaxID=74358 RepID=A0AA35NX19_9SAUR|nr:Hypothetical predicted protein [Podarcis lilfordi]